MAPFPQAHRAISKLWIFLCGGRTLDDREGEGERRMKLLGVVLGLFLSIAIAIIGIIIDTFVWGSPRIEEIEELGDD